MGGEREDALLRHYKTIHLNLRNDEPVPRLIRESLEEYRIALQIAALNGTAPNLEGLDIPSRLPSPVNAPSPTLSTGSCWSSVGPSTPVEDPLYEWASSPCSPSTVEQIATSSDWTLDFDVGAYLAQPQVCTTSTPDQEYDSSFLFDSTHSFGVPSLYDFSAIPLVDIHDNVNDNFDVSEKDVNFNDNSLGLGLTELLNSPLDLDFDFSQTSSIGL